MLSKTLDLLDIFKARSLLVSGNIDSSNIFSDEHERDAFFSLADAVVSDDADRKQASVTAFLFGNGDFEDVPCVYPSLPCFFFVSCSN